MTYKVGMVSLGCPKNQMDAELMLAKLKNSGFELIADSGLADVVIINTCGFIEDAKKESIEQIIEFGKLKDEGRVKKIIVTGCMAERYREELVKELPECDAVLGLGANGDIVEILHSVLKDQLVVRFPEKGCWSLEGERLQTTPDFFAYLRISDGCDNCCTYCAIPMIRGKLRSRQIENIIDEARTLVHNGVKELVLVAQDTTLYGVDLYGSPALPQLLERLCEIEGLRWIRLLYCYPEHITDRLLEVVASQDKVVKYMDIPIQHASGRILEAMNRPGNNDLLRRKIEQIRNRVPGIVLRTTVMTGFPGEGEEEFNQLCDFIHDMRFERLGCFTFSPEEGTAAALMSDQVDEKEKQRRRDIIMQEQSRISGEINSSQTGKVLDVLVESYDRYAECWFGRSTADAPDIDGKVFINCPLGKIRNINSGDMIKVKITDSMDWDLIGECCE
ncbi:MAG TPA: 30S ribosomal protein S12 methylthiotransferase RimO [Ruminococcaceae bacterium]|jgi:ribosomal protein S12 methylthiotransferase|nr:30S ribosomal protein S12 methylthiotransferase RimO [Oscillospiraceae bacterium]